jgi:hypothetical protein
VQDCRPNASRSRRRRPYLNESNEDAAVERLVRGLRLGPPPESGPQDTPAAARDSLFRLARGEGADGIGGVPDFPLNLARHYQDRDRVGLLELGD